MKYTELTRPEIATLPVYEPGKPIEVLAREKGIPYESIIKLASNENPLGAPPRAIAAVKSAAEQLEPYPDNSGYSLVGALCEKFGFEPGQLVLGAGSNEIFYLLTDLFAEPGVEVVVGEYAFISYRISSMLAGAKVVTAAMPGLNHDLDALRDSINERTRLVFLPNPNNPTGMALPSSEVASFARSLPESVVFCYDEAYMEYEEDPLDVHALISEGIKIIGTRTFSKIYGLAGLRIGYGYAHADLAGLLNRARPPFNTGSIGQVAACAALQDDAWVRTCRDANNTGRVQLQQGFEKLGIPHAGNHGNFILLESGDAASLCQSLMDMGVIVRPLAGYGLPQYLRATIGTEQQNGRLLESLTRILK